MAKKNAPAVSVMPVRDIPDARVLSIPQVISAAIRIINRKRQPLLKIVNADSFEQRTPQQWATVYHLMGLSSKLYELEEARELYLQTDEVPVQERRIGV